MYGMSTMYQSTVARQFWIFGLHPEHVSAFIGEYSWKELEQVGTQEYQTRYLTPMGRSLQVMEIERAVYAEKQS
jgi:O-methyltransferase involved in polyketide biosynthesis